MLINNVIHKKNVRSQHWLLQESVVMKGEIGNKGLHVRIMHVILLEVVPHGYPLWLQLIIMDRAKQFGIDDAIDHFNVLCTSITRWNNRMNHPSSSNWWKTETLYDWTRLAPPFSLSLFFFHAPTQTTFLHS